MSITSYLFKARITKVHLLAFVANAPHEFYFFIVPSAGNNIHGQILSTELVEYFLNEFPVLNFEIVQAEEIKKTLATDGYAIWGNRELADF